MTLWKSSQRSGKIQGNGVLTHLLHWINYTVRLGYKNDVRTLAAVDVLTWFSIEKPSFVFFYFDQPPSFVLSNPRSFCNCSALSSLSRRSCVHRCFETTWHRRIVHSYWLRRPTFAHHCGVKHRVARAGLTIGQMPGPHAFGGLALGYQNTPLLVFHIFRLFTTHKIVELFEYCVWYIGQRNW